MAFPRGVALNLVDIALTVVFVTEPKTRALLLLLM
jgi:hypothetical protein